MDLEKIKSKIITIQGQQVILDTDVANLYGVETKRINEAIRNKPEKFPEGYVITLTESKKTVLQGLCPQPKSNILPLKFDAYSAILPGIPFLMR